MVFNNCVSLYHFERDLLDFIFLFTSLCTGSIILTGAATAAFKSVTVHFHVHLNCSGVTLVAIDLRLCFCEPDSYFTPFTAWQSCLSSTSNKDDTSHGWKL